MPTELNPDAAGAILVGGGIGLAPLAIWRRTLADRGIPERSLLGFRDREHSGGMELFRCSEVRLASEDGHAGHHGYVTDLLAMMLEGDSAATAAVYACGPPAMLEAVRAMCEEREVAAELAMESPMACGYGACFGCAVPLRRGGYMRLCVDGPVVGRPTSRRRWSRGPGTDERPRRRALRASALEHPIVNGSGTFDAIAARRAFGDAVLERFPFSAYVSKTITPGAARRQPAAAPLGGAGGDGQLDRAAEQGPRGLPRRRSAAARGAAGAADRLGDGDQRRAVRAARRGRRARATRSPALELNVSCPNVHSGLIVGEQPGETSALMSALRPLTAKPLIVKLTPNVADPAAIAIAAEQAGADAVSLINTIKAAPLLADGRPWLGAGSGGLSGPAVRTIALKQVADVAAAVEIPVVGMGGIERGSHAAALLGAGAAVVAVGTASFRDPLAAERIRGELEALRREAAERRKAVISAIASTSAQAGKLDLDLRLRRIGPETGRFRCAAPSRVYDRRADGPASLDLRHPSPREATTSA